MNTQELIEAIAYAGTLRIEDRPNQNVVEMVLKSEVLELINKLTEPKKVTVPKFVAEWLEVCKENLGVGLFTAMSTNFMRENLQNIECTLWMKSTKNQELFARAWLDGYTIEQEKLYTVEIFGATLYKAVSDNHIRYHMVDYRNLTNSEGPYTYTSKLTEKEIKAADERLWKFAMEVE